MSIPTLDLHLAESDRGEAARQLVAALEEPGFVYLQNVEGYHPDQLLEYTKWFFSLSEEIRMSLARKHWNPLSTNSYRGYYPTIPGVTDFKEGIEFGQELPPDDPDIFSDNYMYESNAWPPETLPGAVEFKRFVLSYYQLMNKLGLEIIHLVAIGLGEEEDHYDKLFLNKPLSTLRLIHYPIRQEPVPEAARKDDLVLSCQEHADTGFVTLLSTFYNEGLQILQQDGVWKDVDVQPHCLVMNVGDALVKITGRFKATRHRVVDYGKERYSVPFFMEPGYHADIGQFAKEVGQRDSHTEEHEPTQYGPWLAARLKAKTFFEFPKENLLIVVLIDIEKLYTCTCTCVC